MEYKIDDLIKAVLIEANEREQTAAYNGEMNDRGASRLKDEVKFYNLGKDGVIPQEWEHYAKHIDPEYQEYLRLRKKFNEG